ncbi:hypothetical protein A3J19_02005 [Candidatus Daviesbacteria bacterium RIFCSPLOWO2_02_FULL_41_8]|uniref:Uncharacterized protein n=3 Tax=Candidatus Daviesiibacteriota TaxID=1752718 RepID=A0A1F5NIA7_9BACT|nr:MAG: hypothetical protein A2871_03240 [Candidatus Daviesbacteria bacterium RIFCSPHIGHO2_01_FULL_41_23]OGE32423.1 MAG: hypothetical protein A3D83_02085 [Candidatus Daviesbacteria bacterium RIFCSPHIGHO2_02_FULL_41_10]OGE61942.1 MAG: hypothetical protein A2967_03055 [Candidatus Daviesbacteria bacterium RIFCSPLOWO2_01_FULL_41_32]OGE77399.1 MAG: hypothetical protein A3J19_02005 [Candidatus Daviesbacteria bacterium RIFCSPLOWO2_02_FULL_41_8]
MLEQATVVNTDQLGALKPCFPQGHEITTDSSVVMVVGPNGSGKTGLLRMMYSSLGFREYFKEHGISQLWHWYGLDTLTDRFFDPDFRGLPPVYCNLGDRVSENTTQIRTGLNAGEVTSDLRGGFETHQLKLGSNPRIKKNGEDYWVISDEETTYAFLLKKSIYKGANLPGFRPDQTVISGQIHVLSSDYVSYSSESIWLDEEERYALARRVRNENKSVDLSDKILNFLASDSRFNINTGDYIANQSGHLIPRKTLKEVKRAKTVFGEKTDLNVWGYLKLGMDDVPTYAKMILPSPGTRYDGQFVNAPTYGDFLIEQLQRQFEPKSVGLTQLQYLERQFESVKDFFEKRIMATPRTKDEWNWQFKGKPLDIPEDAHLILFMDEPTIALDYLNLFKVRDMILGAVRKYSPRLQVFIATNDPILIERTPEAKFVSLYGQPATSFSSFSELQHSLPQV